MLFLRNGRSEQVRPGTESLYDVYEDATRPSTAVRAAGWLVFVAGVVGLAVLYRAELRHALRFRTVFLVNIGTLLVTALGLALATRRERMIRRQALPRWELVAVAGLTLVGVLMRTVMWNVFPPVDGQLLEEPQVGWCAVQSIRFGAIDAYFPIVNLIGEVGFRTIGPTMNGLRIPFVVLGILSVPIFYIAARLFLKSPVAALFVTFLFATNSMLAGSSRIALETMHPIFTLVLALAVVFYAGQRPTVGRCALAGVFNGILLTEYDSYRLTPFLNFIYLAIRLWTYPNDASEFEVRITRRRWLACLSAYGAFWVGIEIPFVLASPQDPFAYLTGAYHRHSSYLGDHRAHGVWIQLALEEWVKFKTNIGQLFLHGDGPDILPGNMGHFDLYTGILGVVALGFCLLGAWWNPLRLFPVIALSLITVLSSVLVGNIARYRLMPAIPYYLLAIGLLVAAIEARFPRARRVLIFVSMVAAVTLGLVNVHRFFGVAIWNDEVQQMFYDLNMVLSHEISELQRRDPGARIVVLSDQNHLGVANDYAFWYNYETVKVFTSPEPARGQQGYLLAHDRFIPKPEDLPGMRDCVKWTTKFNRNVILRCRLVAESQSPVPDQAGTVQSPAQQSAPQGRLTD
jgi:hypothetical protein